MLRELRAFVVGAWHSPFMSLKIISVRFAIPAERKQKHRTTVLKKYIKAAVEANDVGAICEFAQSILPWKSRFSTGSCEGNGTMLDSQQISVVVRRIFIWMTFIMKAVI
jgi:hypothetical protein